MAIDITPEGPKARISSEAQESSLNFDDLLKQANDLLDDNTASAAESPKTAAAPDSRTKIEVLTDAAKSFKGQRGYASKKIRKKIAYLTGQAAPKFEKMDDIADQFHEAHAALKEQMSGLVTNRINEDGSFLSFDAAEDFHKHISNLIELAQRHLQAASLKEERGQRTSAIMSADALIKKRTGTRIRPEDVAGDSDGIEKLAPVNLDRGETPPPSEAESIRYINDFSNNEYLNQAANVEAMGAVGHVKHAVHLLAGVTKAVQDGLDQIHSNVETKKTMANNGKVAPKGRIAAQPFAQLLDKFLEPAKNYADFAEANPGVREGDQVISGVAARFGLENDLKFRNNLAKSGEYQKIIEQQHAKLKNWYNQKYGALIAKRDASRGRLVSTETQRVELPGATGAIELGKSAETEAEANIRGYVEELKSRGSYAKIQHEYNLENPNSAVYRSPNRGWQRIGDALKVPIRFNEDGSYKEHGAGFTVDPTGVAQESTVTSIAEDPIKNKVNDILSAADKIKELGASHPLTPRWHSIADRAKSIISTYGLNPRLHESAVRQSTALLSKVQDSMDRNGVLPKTEIREKTQGFPSYSEIAEVANVRKLPQEAKNSRIDEEVDPTWGGELSDMDIASGKGVAVPQYPSFMRPNPVVITNPSREGFHIPTDIGITNSRRRRRAAALAEAAESARRSQAEESFRRQSGGSGFFDIPGPEPIDLSKLEKAGTSKYTDETGLLLPTESLKFDGKDEDLAEERTAEKTSKKRAKSTLPYEPGSDLEKKVSINHPNGIEKRVLRAKLDGGRGVPTVTPAEEGATWWHDKGTGLPVSFGLQSELSGAEEMSGKKINPVNESEPKPSTTSSESLEEVQKRADALFNPSSRSRKR